MKLAATPFGRSVVRMFGSTLLASLLTPPLFGAGVTVRFSGEPLGEGGRYNRALAEEWAQKTGNKVEYFFRTSDSSALQVYQQYWAAKSSDVDVYLVDVIWQGIAAPHAVDLKKYYDEEVQKRIAIRFSVLPTRPALYSDPEVLAKSPFFKIMPNVFNNAVARPSTVTGGDYNQLSTAFFQNVNTVLTGGESAQAVVSEVEKVAKRILR